MADILPFRRKKLEPTASEPPPSSIHGLIEIRADDAGDHIKVNGAYTDRLQHGAFVALRLLNMFVDKIAASDGAGYSSSETLQTILPNKRKALPDKFGPDATDLAPLEQPRRRRR
jgi:hypothetical protein